MAFEKLETRWLLTSVAQNPLHATDVNGDCRVSPIDALVVINELNSPGIHAESTRTFFFDVDGSGDVGITDFLDMLATWGPCPDPPEPCPADIDYSGDVGITDVLKLLALWGPCP